MFSSSSRSQMGSNAVTGQNQGGGVKRLGFLIKLDVDGKRLLHFSKILVLENAAI